MVQKFSTTCDVQKNPGNNGINYQPQLVSLPDFWLEPSTAEAQFRHNYPQTNSPSTKHELAGGFKYFLFSSLPAKSPILTSIFFKGVGSTTN